MSLWSETLQHNAGQTILVSFKTPSDVRDSFTLNVSEPSFQVVFSFDGSAFNVQHNSPEGLSSVACTNTGSGTIEYTVTVSTATDTPTTIEIYYNEGTQLINAYAVVKE